MIRMDYQPKLSVHVAPDVVTSTGQIAQIKNHTKQCVYNLLNIRISEFPKLLVEYTVFYTRFFLYHRSANLYHIYIVIVSIKIPLYFQTAWCMYLSTITFNQKNFRLSIGVCLNLARGLQWIASVSKHKESKGHTIVGSKWMDL